MAEVKIEYEFLLDQNLGLYELIRLCDSVNASNDDVILELNTQLTLERTKLQNKDSEIGLLNDKVDITKMELTEQKKKKNLYLGTSAGLLLLAVILAL